MSDIPPDNSPSEPARRVQLPPVREFNDRATLWLLEDPHNLRDLLRIHSPQLVEHLDFDRAERLNCSFIPPDLQKEESDLLFRVPYVLRSEVGEIIQDILVYLLLEHQSKPDYLMPLRLLAYMLQLWEAQRREWEDNKTPMEARKLTLVVPFVFYTGERNWTAPKQIAEMFDVPAGFERFVPSWETLFLDLQRTPSEQLTGFVNSIGWALRALQAEQASYAEIEQTLREAMAGLEQLDEEAAGQWIRVAWYLLLLVTHRRSPTESPNLVELLQEQSRGSKFREREEWQTMEMSYADYLKEQGRAEVRAEVRAEGVRALRSALETVLTARFKKLPKKVKEAIAAADLDTINDWIRIGSTANTLEEVGIAR
jgi:hypothetical protein